MGSNANKTSNESQVELAENRVEPTDVLKNDNDTNAHGVEAYPCTMIACGVGRDCYLDEETGDGRCECIKDCGLEEDPRRKVCTNQNETFSSECAVHQLRCYCEEGHQDQCLNPEQYKHVHIDYFGECRMIPYCKPDELADFPRRMREWLYHVMQELSERKELSYYYQKMEEEAEENLSRRWSNAAIWKWCDLDKGLVLNKTNTNNGGRSDNAVSRHELFPVIAPLKTMEHCIGEFLDQCDTDENHLIDLKEWGKCLEIPEEEMEQRCEEVQQQ